jgi:hypothetical protein
MGSDAELVVLSMGLALRDIFAAQFIEEDDDSNDCPDWIRSSPLRITDGEELMDLWKKQLPAEKRYLQKFLIQKAKARQRQHRGREKLCHPRRVCLQRKRNQSKQLVIASFGCH